MDFPLSSSVILVVAVALWIVWVAPYVLRNRRHQLQPAAELMAEINFAEPADPQAGNVMKMAAQQEKSMVTKQSTGSAQGSVTTAAGPGPATARPGALRIRYGRCAIALVGVAALLTGVVAGIFRIFGMGSSWLPVGSLLAAIAAVALLRRLAVRDRRAKMNAAFRAAMTAPERQMRAAVPRPSREPAVDAPDIPLFDAEAGNKPQVKPLTAQELREAALAEAKASGDTALRTATAPGSAAGADSSWEPVDVPKPTYVEAAKAERAAPDPLDLPEAPKAVGKPSLKQGPAAAPAASGAATKPLTKAQSALSNLDDVLQRRRA
ncbi:hypothetical protein [Arthrobacter sp. PvP023]|uniref:hypothetical protein n=1 Tax=Arthrobacter sp. PvP023 TaxID=2806585 RepID=UPI0027DB9A0F|nr:hypothetical protein [Arthrobacter sp. PvP023]